MISENATESVLTEIDNLGPDDQSVLLAKSLVSVLYGMVMLQEVETGISWANPDVFHGPLKSIALQWTQYTKKLTICCASFDLFAQLHWVEGNCEWEMNVSLPILFVALDCYRWFKSPGQSRPNCFEHHEYSYVRSVNCRSI